MPTTRSIHRRATLIEVVAALTLAAVFWRPALLVPLVFLAVVVAIGASAGWLSGMLVGHVPYRYLAAGFGSAAVLVAGMVGFARVDWSRLPAVGVSVATPTGVMVAAAAAVTAVVVAAAVVSNRAVAR